MRKIIFFSVIQQLLYHISRVESLIGQNFTPIRGGEFPFTASFQSFPDGYNFCGGALITKKHVITFAYCLRDLSPDNFRIVFEVAHAQEPAVAYTVTSWTTYLDWAREQGIYENSVLYNVAIVTLTDKVYHVNPIPIYGLTKIQLNGKSAIMIGRKNDVLSKKTVELLSDQDCQTKVSVICNDVIVNDVRILCTADANNSIALLEMGDTGSPLIHARDNSLLGIAFAPSPAQQHVTGNFSTEFIQQHQVNGYFNINYYRSFIYSIIPAAPAA